MHRRTVIVLIAICLTVLLTAPIVGCVNSNNSDGSSDDGGDMMDNNGGSGDEMMDNDGSGGDQGNGTMNP